MTRRALLLLVQELRAALGSARAVVGAFAAAMAERRGVPPPAGVDAAAAARVEAAPEIGTFLSRDDALADVYGALNEPALEAAYRGSMRERRKFTTEEVSAVTGLFTPKWVAELLMHNTLGHLCHPQGELAGRLQWRLAAACEPEDVHFRRARDIRILDPACGTMNFGLAAVDLLREMYREEMDRAGRPGWPAEPSVRGERDIGPAMLRHNLFGFDIDATALWLARLSLNLKLGLNAGPEAFNLHQGDALADGPLTHPCIGGFDVVVTNPPYLSARNLPADVVKRLKKAYPFAWRDLYACFILRCLDFCRAGGRAGLLTMQSFMFTSAFRGLRADVHERVAIETLVHFGPGLFEGGNPGTLQTVAFTLRREQEAVRRVAHSLVAVRLCDVPGADGKRDALARLLPRAAPGDGDSVFDVRQGELRQLPRQSWAYWATPELRRAFATMPKLRDVAPPRQGLATTDNARFVRFWWEVEPTRPDAPVRSTVARWFPYAKSGRFRRWYEAPRHRVNWEDDGREIKQEIIRRYPYLKGDWQWVAKNASWYGRPGGITYSYLTSGRFSARRLEPGSIFDVAGSSLFPPNDPLAVLAVLNSSAAARLLGVINPTVNFQVGDLGELPLPAIESADTLAPLVGRAIQLQRDLDKFDETTSDFERPTPWFEANDVVRAAMADLAAVEGEIENIVCDAYGFKTTCESSRGLDDAFGDDTRVELARQWVSFAVGRVLGRWGGDAPNDPCLQMRPLSRALLRRIENELEACAGKGAPGQIGAAVGGIPTFLAKGFYPWHVALHRRRPLYWAFGRGERVVLIAHDVADAGTLKQGLRRVGEAWLTGWQRHMDDGITVNLAPLAGCVADRALGRALATVAADLRTDRLGWSETAGGAAACVSRGSTCGFVRAPTGQQCRPRPSAARK